jgi:hypothetical protein
MEFSNAEELAEQLAPWLDFVQERPLAGEEI